MRVLLLLLLATGASAQTTPSAPAAADSDSAATGTIQGEITGSDGAVYEGVRVALAAADKEPQVEVTDGEGEFTFSHVPPGSFTLTVSSEGFATKAVSGMLGSGESLHEPAIVLSMERATSEVRVSAAQQAEIAEVQVRIEEQQRVLGVLPNFYVSYAKNPVPLTARQKYSLAWRTNIDPFTFLMNGAFAGIEQANNTFAGYGQGARGYARRFGANTADTFVSTELGNAILPVLFKQDPRYFYKGTGTIWARARYAVATAFICKGDNMRWQFNYSGILGGLAAGGVSNLYYPASDRGNVSVTFENAGVGIAGSAAQNLFQEFIVKRLTPRARKTAMQ